MSCVTPGAGVTAFPAFSRGKVQSPHSKAHRDGWVTSQREGKGNQGRVELLKRARKGAWSRNAGKMGIPTATSPAGSPEHTQAGQVLGANSHLGS